MQLGNAGSAWLSAAILAGALALLTTMAARASTENRTDGFAVYWTDGDSGRLSDGTRFRLHGVDAPETGGVGARGGADCEPERELGYAAKEEALNLTRGERVRVSRDYGLDRYGRLVVDLAVGDLDVAGELVLRGALKSWDYDGGERKPDWCSVG